MGKPPGLPHARYRWVVLALATTMQVGMSLPQQTPAAIGPVLTEALHLNRTELGLLTSAIWGGMLLGILPLGILIDRYGERWVVAAGAVMLAVFLFLAAQTSSFLQVFLLLLPAAVGASCSSPGGTRAIAAWFPRHQRGIAMGIRQTGVTTAGILSAIILPPIAVAFRWPAAFLTVAALALVAALLFVILYREPARRPGWVRPPLELGALIRNEAFLRATAFGWIFMGALGSSVAYLTLSLHQQQGLGAVSAGFFLGVLQFGGLVGRVGWGLYSDRLRSRRLTMTMAMAGGLAVLSALAMAGSSLVRLPVVALALLVLLLGLSALGWNALYITLCAEVGPVERAATVVGLGTTVTFTGMLLLTPLLGLIADRTGSYAPAWAGLGLLELVGVILALGARDRAHLVRAGAGSIR
jgi:sugar phosphate permease